VIYGLWNHGCLRDFGADYRAILVTIEEVRPPLDQVASNALAENHGLKQ
jgi:hypothetical protein